MSHAASTLLFNEREQNLLIVTPQGDMVGFSNLVVTGELAELVKTIGRDQSIEHIVVDLSDRNYFGSDVIGVIARLAETIQSRNGKLALAGASEDMLGVLAVMKVDQFVQVYADREAALNDLLRSPTMFKLKGAGRTIAFITLPIIIVVTMFLAINSGMFAGWNPFAPPTGTALAENHYEELEELWENIRTASKERRQSDFRPDSQRVRRSIVRSIDVSSQEESLVNALQKLLEAAELCITMAETSIPIPEKLDRQFNDTMAAARSFLDESE